MNDASKSALGILARLGAQPAVAFHEAGVIAAVKEILGELKLDFRTDSYGNIISWISGVASDLPEPFKETERIPPIAFVAHLDHPGFEAVAVDGDYLVGQALGSVPPASFSSGVPLQVLLPEGQRLPAATAGPYGPEEDRQVLIMLEEPQPVPLPCPVVFDLTDFTLEEDLIRMRALDDLAGCGSILAALAGLSRQVPPGDVYGVFTRAEEVGLVGARLLAEAGTLPQDTLVVSIESSRTLPGAEIGNGPVIRVGDAGFTFNADAEAVLLRARETLQSRSQGFKVQRQLMSGGTCEASAFAQYGYRTTGMAFPLGNYHNGAPEGDIRAEYIHREDFLGGVELLMEAALQVPQREDTYFRRRISELPAEYRARLQQSAG
ncbi:MAG: M20/M25/M40 family metallo-hydrolase [Dehalococcoidia bacterium]